MNQYLSNIYNILFNPDKAFIDIKENLSISNAAFTLFWITIAMYSFTCAIPVDFWSYFLWNFFWHTFCFIFYLFGIYFTWLMNAIFYEYVAKIFNKSGQIKLFLCLSAYSLMPLIFIAPLRQLRNLGDVGYFLGLVLEIIVYFWIIFLYCKALSYTYNLSISRIIMLIFLPFVSILITAFWSIGFFSKLIYILNT